MSNHKIADSIGAKVVATNRKYAGKTAKYLAELRYRLRRLEKGLCPTAGCGSLGPGMCEECLAKQAAYRRGLRMRNC